MVFSDYARYYDLLNQNKDYDHETEYVSKLIKKHDTSSVDILDLGCGSGTHALRLAKRGFQVVGVDRSKEQLQLAKAKVHQDAGIQRGTEFHLGDIRQLSLGRKFDAAISLFHVMSYQSENEDLYAAFKVARAHLKAGGLFIFDAWYGPGVLSIRPETRIKRVDTDVKMVIRIAQPTMKTNLNCVDVHYELLIYDRTANELETIKEIHRMRYFFLPEIIFMLKCSGFRLLKAEEWLSGNPLDANTWSCCFLAVADDWNHGDRITKC